MVVVLDRERLLSGGAQAAAAIAAAEAQKADTDWISTMHGSLVHCAALGESHHIRDHAPQAAELLKLQALS